MWQRGRCLIGFKVVRGRQRVIREEAARLPLPQHHARAQMRQRLALRQTALRRQEEGHEADLHLLFAISARLQKIPHHQKVVCPSVSPAGCSTC